jgi:cytochrome oxidase Cu insertion factor (SCO1/SenC/PrrC family)
MASGTDSNEQVNQGNGRKILLILVVIFVLPFTVAALLHLFKVQPGGHSYGELIKPPQALHFPDLKDANDKPFNAQDWDKKWTVVTIDPAICAEACHERLHLLRQVHTSLGKEFDRVQRVSLIPAEINNDTARELQTRYSNLIVLSGADASILEFINSFNLPSATADAGAQVYLVDPLGNLMMIYPHDKEDLDPRGLRKDLTRLLKNSWAG